MKKIFAIAAIFVGASIMQQANAQVNVNKQPTWGPTGNNHVDYYYLPEADSYYSVDESQFIYNDGRKWVKAKALPSKYRNVDLYKTYKVVVNKPNPYLQNNVYKNQYAQYKGRHDQPVIRDSRDKKYTQNNNQPKQQSWDNNRKQEPQKNGKKH